MQKGGKTLFAVLAQELKLRNYSHKTLKAYRSCLRSLIVYFSPRHPRELTNEDIRTYLLYLIEKKKVESFHSQSGFQCNKILVRGAV